MSMSLRMHTMQAWSNQISSARSMVLATVIVEIEATVACLLKGVFLMLSQQATFQAGYRLRCEPSFACCLLLVACAFFVSQSVFLTSNWLLSALFRKNMPHTVTR